MLDGWEDLLASWRPLNMGCKVQDGLQNGRRGAGGGGGGAGVARTQADGMLCLMAGKTC